MGILKIEKGGWGQKKPFYQTNYFIYNRLHTMKLFLPLSFLCFTIVILGISEAQAQVSIKRSTISCFGPSTTTYENFSLQQTAGQSSIVSTWQSSDADIFLRQGFIQPPISILIPAPITVKSFHLFPNPTNGEINFMVDLNGNSKSFYYEIKNMLGQNINTGKGESKLTHKVDLSDVAEGMYFLSIRSINNEKLTTRKIIVIK
jgi:hypothetical protein